MIARRRPRLTTGVEFCLRYWIQEMHVLGGDEIGRTQRGNNNAY